MEVRGITPRAFANDGLRVHVRALCHKEMEFKDFNLSRIEKIVRVCECPDPDRVDEEWQSFVWVEIAANPEMKPLQRAAIERDYAMQNGCLRLKVRKALKLYTLRRLGFVQEDQQEMPRRNECNQLLLLREIVAGSQIGIEGEESGGN